MSDAPAQLGQMPGINLGGYVPAPVRNTSMQREVLQSMLEQIGGKLAGTAIDKLTTPDLAPAINQAMSSGQPVQFPKAAWYQEPANQAMMTQYSMQQPVSKAQAQLTGAEAAKTAAGTPYVGGQAQANIAATQAGTGLTQAETGRMSTLTPAQYEQLQAETGKTQAETGRISTLTPEEAAATRAGTAKTIVEAQGQAAHNVAGFGGAQVGLLNAQAGDVTSQTKQRAAEAAKTSAQMAFTMNTMQQSKEAEIIRAFGGGSDAKEAVNSFKRKFGVVPPDGDITFYLSQMHSYVSHMLGTK